MSNFEAAENAADEAQRIESEYCDAIAQPELTFECQSWFDEASPSEASLLQKHPSVGYAKVSMILPELGLTKERVCKKVQADNRRKANKHLRSKARSTIKLALATGSRAEALSQLVPGVTPSPKNIPIPLIQS